MIDQYYDINTASQRKRPFGILQLERLIVPQQKYMYSMQYSGRKTPFYYDAFCEYCQDLASAVWRVVGLPCRNGYRRLRTFYFLN